MKALLTATITALAAMPVLASSDQPYAGQQAREIASLSQADIEELLAGAGWGLAKPAELNGYPGPIHILELADELDLTPEQRAEVQKVYDAMQAEAQALGAQYIEAERHLSMMFRLGHANPAALESQLAASGAALTRLRNVHLVAHLEITPVLTDEQRETYARLRGYGSDGEAEHSGHGGH